VFGEIWSAECKRFEGKKVAEVAVEMGVAPFDALLDVVAADDLRTWVSRPIGGKDDEETRRVRAELWLDERTAVGASDAGAHLQSLDTFASCVQLLSEGVRSTGCCRWRPR